MRMRKRSKITAMLLMLFMIIGCLAGCKTKDNQTVTKQSGNDEGNKENANEAGESIQNAKKITLKVWGSQEEQKPREGYKDGLLKFMCDKFNEAHIEWDITYTYGVVGENDCKTELSKDAEAGADVFMFASDQTSFLQESGILAPITLYQEEVTQMNGGMEATCIQGATFDQLLYAVPFTPNSCFLYYDNSKYTEEEVKSLEVMMAKDLGGASKNFCIDIKNGWYNAPFFFAGGCSLFGANGRDSGVCDFNNEMGVTVGNYIAQLCKSQKFLQETDNGANALQGFKEGTLGAWCSGTWHAESVKEALGDHYAATKLPTISLNGTDCQLKSFADYKYIGVNMNTDSNAMEAAQALAVYLGGEECQKIRFEERSIAPTVTSLIQDKDVLNNVAVAALILQASHTQFQSTLPQMTNFWAPAEAFGESCYNGEANKDNMQEQLDSFVKNVLATITQ